MPHIKAVSIAYTPAPANRLAVVDDQGRVWIKTMNGQWAQEELPEEPDPEVMNVNRDLSSLQ